MDQLDPAGQSRDLAAVLDVAPSPAGVAAAAAVADRLEDLLVLGTRLDATLQATVGLRLGQARLLNAIGDGHTTVPALSRVLGEHPAAVGATLGTLREVGLVAVSDSRDGGAEPAVLTEVGRVRLDQLAALQLRHAAARADEHGPSTLAAVRPLRRPAATTSSDSPPPDRPAA